MPDRTPGEIQKRLPGAMLDGVPGNKNPVTVSERISEKVPGGNPERVTERIPYEVFGVSPEKTLRGISKGVSGILVEILEVVTKRMPEGV